MKPIPPHDPPFKAAISSLVLLTFSFSGPGALRAAEIPADAAGPPGAGNTPGFLVRSVQSEEFLELPQTLNRGIFQLDGTLTDDDGKPVADESEPGPNPDGSYNVDGIVNFELFGEETGNFLEDVEFPGIPGTGGHVNNFTSEVVAFLELSAGEHTFGGQVYIDRTDSIDDDTFTVLVGAQPRDFFATQLGTFERSEFAPPFEVVPDDFEFTFTAPSAGVYPFRLVYLQKAHKGTLEFYSLHPQTKNRIPINDPGNANAIKAYRVSTAVNHNRAYIAEVRPQPGSAGVKADTPVQILLLDDGTSVDPNSIHLFYNGVDDTADAVITSAGGRTTIQYALNPNRSTEANDLRLLFKDSMDTEFNREWSFTNITDANSEPKVTGHWDFTGGLTATVGQDMEFFAAVAEEGTVFGTTTAIGVPDIDGEVADIMSVPEGNDRGIGYLMHHGIPPNGGGTKVNQYTLLMDVMLPEGASGAAGIIQISSLANTDDSDLFWQNGNMGQGGGGYEGDGSFTAGAWHRVVFSVDLAANPPVINKFVDGVNQQEGGWIQQNLDQNRRALRETSVLFTDGDQDEQQPWFVNSVQIRDGAMSNEAVEMLGGPTAAGLPLPNLTPFILTDITVDPTTGDVTISWNSRPGASYAVDASTSLETQGWIELTDGVISPGTTTMFTDPGAALTNEVRYYRVREE